MWTWLWQRENTFAKYYEILLTFVPRHLNITHQIMRKKNEIQFLCHSISVCLFVWFFFSLPRDKAANYSSNLLPFYHTNNLALYPNCLIYLTNTAEEVCSKRWVRSQFVSRVYWYSDLIFEYIKNISNRDKCIKQNKKIYVYDSKRCRKHVKHK